MTSCIMTSTSNPFFIEKEPSITEQKTFIWKTMPYTPSALKSGFYIANGTLQAIVENVSEIITITYGYASGTIFNLIGGPIHDSMKFIRELTISSKYRLTRKIDIKINREDKYYFAENEEFNIYANGLNSSEAVDDFCKQLIYYYEYYAKLSDDQIIGEAIRLKNIYKDVLTL